MKKITTFILLSIFGLSSAFAQNEQRLTSILNSRESLLRKNNQLEKLSPFNKHTSFISPATKTNTELNTKSLIALNDSIYNLGWDTLTNGWMIKPQAKTINMVYDAHNNLTSELDQFWTGGIWQDIHQFIYTYDSNNNLTSKLGQTWNNGYWRNSGQYIYTYDANNNLTSELVKYGNLSEWVDHRQTFYTYNANNNMIYVLGQVWNGSTWVNEIQNIYTYDANNNRTSELFQEWNGVDWVNSYQSNITNNANNNMTYRLVQSWTGSAWVNYTQYLLTYDANNNLTNELEQDWNGTTWNKSGTAAYTYDANNFMKSSSSIEWGSLGTKVILGDSLYYYFRTVLGINDLIALQGNITIYPNPASDIVTLNIDNRNNADLTLNIYNIVGELVRSETLKQNNRQINVGDLRNGIYMVEIKSKEWSKKQKLIIQR